MGLRLLAFVLRTSQGPSRPHATAATAGAACVIALSALFWSAGSRPALFCAAATLAAAVVDGVWASVASRHISVEVLSNPADALAGDTVRLRVRVRGAARPYALRLRSNPHSTGVLATPPVEGDLAAYLEHRGVVAEMDLEAIATGPCGLAGWVRRTVLPLAEPVAVGPRPLEPARTAVPLAAAVDGGTQARPAVNDQVRGVRPYMRGDAARHVHWPATAHAGELIVKEVEEQRAPRLVLALDLGAGGEEGEEAARRAAWYALDALRSGQGVTLVTVEASGPVTGSVATAQTVNRRLARAVPGPPPPLGHATLVVGATGDRWS